MKKPKQNEFEPKKNVAKKKSLEEKPEENNSPVSQELLEHFSKKFGPRIAPLVLLKSLPPISSKLERPRVSVLHVGPSRALKSFTSSEVMSIFSEEFWIDLRSDFTMNSLRRYKDELKTGKCLFVNDGTTLFASKGQRTKDRLVGGLGELIADEVYTYQDYGKL
jgi:hypothetical protein